MSFFLAQIDGKDLMTDLQKTGVSQGGLAMLLTACGVVTLLILVWAIFIRKRPDDTSRRYSYPSRDSKIGAAANSDELAAKSERRGRRRRKRRSRNPTLAETGGLPPIRSDSYFEDPP